MTLKVSILQPQTAWRKLDFSRFSVQKYQFCNLIIYGEEKGKVGISYLKKVFYFIRLSCFSNIFRRMQKSLGTNDVPLRYAWTRNERTLHYKLISVFVLKQKPDGRNAVGLFCVFTQTKNDILKIFAEFCNFFSLTVEICKKIRITIMKAICGTCFALRFCDKF